MMPSTFSPNAALLASDFYDEARTLADVADIYSAKLAEINLNAVMGATRRVSRHLLDDLETTVLRGLLYRGVGQLFDFTMRRVAADTIIKNAKVEKTTFARVPVSNCCDFCLMLGSRGFVYHTAANAGEGRKYHANCRCQVVPSCDKKHPALDGYDPANLYEQWKNTDRDIEALANSAARAKYRNPERTRAQERLRYQEKRGYENPDGSYASPRSAAQGKLRQTGRKNPDAPTAGAAGGGAKPPISHKLGGAMDDRPDYNSTNWWPKSVGDPKDLPPFPGERWTHVEQRHLYENVKARMKEGDTAFPPGWGASQIGQAGAQILRNLDNRQTEYLYEGLTSIDTERVVIRVWLEHDWLPTGEKVSIIGTIHAIRGDNVQIVENGRLKPRALRPDER